MFYPFTESDKDLLEKIREDMFGGPCIVFTRNGVTDDIFLWESTNFSKSIVGIDASQFCLFSMCQATPTGPYTRRELDSESGKFQPRQINTKSFENMVMSFFQRVRPQYKVENFYTAGTQKTIDAYSVDGFCKHCNTVFEIMGCYYHCRPCQKTRLCLTEEEIPRGNK